MKTVRVLLYPHRDASVVDNMKISGQPHDPTLLARGKTHGRHLRCGPVGPRLILNVVVRRAPYVPDRNTVTTAQSVTHNTATELRTHLLMELSSS